MNRADAYRTDVNTAVRFFRPVLAKLNIRNADKQKPVYLAEFDHLDFLNMDYCVVTVLLADMKDTKGLFFCRKTEQICYFYIVINVSLYKDENLEKVKMVGVHEFCHFMALLYSLSATVIEHQRDVMTERLSQKIDELNNKSLDRFYSALNNFEKDNDYVPELDDDHFRLGYEGNTADYDVLLKNFLISKELFDEYFTPEKQEKFRKLMDTTDDAQIGKALLLFSETVNAVAKAKSIPRNFAFKQAISWVKEYLRVKS